MAAGEGIVDWTAVFGELRRIEYDGFLSIHCEYDIDDGEDWFDTFVREVAFFRKMRENCEEGGVIAPRRLSKRLKRMIKSLKVEGLNHRVDADLEFNEDLNIITGKNGSGKTTLLKLLWYLISGNLKRIITEIPFRYISFETNSFRLYISPGNAGEIILTSRLLKEQGLQKSGTLEQLDDTIRELNKRIAQTTKRSLFFPAFRRIEGGYSDLSDVDHSDRSTTLAPEAFQSSLERFSTEISTNGHRFIVSISTNDIGLLLTQKYADINEEINNLQSRVLEDISQRIQDGPSVLNNIQHVADERDRLHKPFLVLSELTQSILQYQAIRVSGQSVHGEATDGITLGEEKDGTVLEAAKEAIASDKLSAGEKQMLSFLCYNAFSESAVIFIDEPELSLHVDWQRLLLPTLLEQGTENQLFIATHSPFIYAKYPDKEILLGDVGI